MPQNYMTYGSVLLDTITSVFSAYYVTYVSGFKGFIYMSQC